MQVRDWNEAHAGNGDLHISAVHLHAMPIREQLQLLQNTRVMIGVNGGQINALFFLPQGSTHAAIFAMRWTDQNFGYVYHSWCARRRPTLQQHACCCVAVLVPQVGIRNMLALCCGR